MFWNGEIWIFSRLPFYERESFTIWIFCLCVCPLRHFFQKFEDIYLFKGDIWNTPYFCSEVFWLGSELRLKLTYFSIFANLFK